MTIIIELDVFRNPMILIYPVADFERTRIRELSRGAQ